MKELTPEQIQENWNKLVQLVEDTFEGERKEGLSYNIVVKKTEHGMLVEKIKREPPPKELEKIAYSSLEELESKNIET